MQPHRQLPRTLDVYHMKIVQLQFVKGLDATLVHASKARAIDPWVRYCIQLLRGRDHGAGLDSSRAGAVLLDAGEHRLSVFCSDMQRDLRSA